MSTVRLEQLRTEPGKAVKYFQQSDGGAKRRGNL